MAELQMTPKTLLLGRAPNGRIVIQVCEPVQLPGGQMIQSPCVTFMLDKQEEERYRALFMGIETATELPRPVSKLEAVH